MCLYIIYVYVCICIIFIFIFSLILQRLNKSPDCLSLSEIVHAIVLLVHVHSLCSFVYSCYLNENPYNTDIDKCNNNVLDSLCEPEKSHSSKGCSRLGWRRPKGKCNI